MYLELPHVEMTKANSCSINQIHFPLSLEFYDSIKEGEILTLKAAAEEIHDIARRYVVIYPSTVHLLEGQGYTGFRCLVNDDNTGISRGILERIGYSLEESDYTPFGIYWITLKTREEKRKKK